MIASNATQAIFADGDDGGLGSKTRRRIVVLRKEAVFDTDGWACNLSMFVRYRNLDSVDKVS